MTSIFAHRGYHESELENTVGAVRAARDLGADGVEIDVWLTPDHYLVVHHDRTVAGHSLTGVPLVGNREIAALARLDEVIEAAGDLRVNVEIKSTRSTPYNLAVARAVVEQLYASPGSSRCMVSSFSLAICEEVRRRAPDRAVGWLVLRRPAHSVLDQVVRSGLTSAHFPFSRVTSSVAQRARDHGVELHVWTPNLARDIDRMLALEVGALITDDVALALELRAGPESSTVR